ncbi:hypothetical protein QA612_21360 [Evansella sp. AB-P1]|uniref:hypothetical protein n=1 Tax=Evansella sp. AB-P1 TaxID=3037653 RepID=UPI00242016AD|nr:hypothetical protein [Evansella sp. AB-P1]MDG5790008.1 hypothetical protein [Evansella sp. AB-P1]
MREFEDMKDYIALIDAKLRYFPLEEKKQHINEIKDDIVTLKEEIIAETGCNEEVAEKKAIASFVPASQLATEIIDQYNKEQDDIVSSSNFGFNISFVAVTSGFALMSLPVHYGEITETVAGSLLAYSIKFIIGCLFLFGYFHSRLDAQKLKVLRQSSLIMIVLLAFPLLGLILQYVRFETITMFSLYFLGGYLVAWAILFIFLVKLYKTAKTKVAIY